MNAFYNNQQPPMFMQNPNPGVNINPMMNPNNPLFNNFGGYQNFMNGLNSFAQQLHQDPRMQAQQMLNSGQMTQQQFEQLRQMANALTGMNL